MSQLQRLECWEHVQEKNGPLFGGQKMSGLDCMLGPKLKHTIIATKEIKARLRSPLDWHARI